MSEHRYMAMIDGDSIVFFALDTCPACNGSGKQDPNVILGGRKIPLAGVCRICRGNKSVATVIDPVEISPKIRRELSIRLWESVGDFNDRQIKR